MAGQNVIMTTDVIRVTRDSGANLKILKKLELLGLIDIHDVMLENGRNTKKVSKKILPVAVFDHARWDEAVFAEEGNKYDDIRSILGKEKVKDAMQLEAHLRNKLDYFVTEDTDFILIREVLKEKFGAEIVTPEELAEKFSVSL